MTMPTCGTCKHWGNTKDEQYRFRRCLRVFSCTEVRGPDDEERANRTDEEIEKWGAWGADEIRKLRSEKAYTVDGSGYYNALKCREDFGCVLHEARV
jgi:hypothetical protein